MRAALYLERHAVAARVGAALPLAVRNPDRVHAGEGVTAVAAPHLVALVAGAPAMDSQALFASPTSANLGWPQEIGQLASNLLEGP